MKEKLLILSDAHELPTTYITLHTLQELQDQYDIETVPIKKINYTKFFSGEYKLILLRQCDPILSFYLLKLIEKYKPNYIYYIDDNFWELSGSTPVGKYYSNQAVQKTINRYIQNAHLIIAASQNLLDYIKNKYPDKKAIFINPGFDFNLINNLSIKRNSKLKIVYAGTIYREHDFQCVVDAVKRISMEFKNEIDIHFNGYAPQALNNISNVFFDEKLCNYEDFIKKQYQSGFDIGLAPLADTLSNRAKSNLKYREYSACKIAGIYTNIPPYSNCIINGFNGLLVNHDEKSWYEAIKKLIENTDLRMQIAQKAYEAIKHNYSNRKIAPIWYQYLVEMPLNEKINISSIEIMYQKVLIIIRDMSNKFLRLYNFYQYHGAIKTMKRIFMGITN